MYERLCLGHEQHWAKVHKDLEQLWIFGVLEEVFNQSCLDVEG